MCHKTDSLDKCVHVSLKILDLGILDVASLTASSEGENTQDEDVMGEISTGAATPGECAEETIFFILLRRRRHPRFKTRNRRQENNGSVLSFKIGFQHFFSKPALFFILLNSLNVLSYGMGYFCTVSASNSLISA